MLENCVLDTGCMLPLIVSSSLAWKASTYSQDIKLADGTEEGIEDLPRGNPMAWRKTPCRGLRAMDPVLTLSSACRCSRTRRSFWGRIPGLSGRSP